MTLDEPLPAVSVLALIAAILAAVYAYRTYQLKSGVKARCSYSITSSIDCEDKYVSNVTLENLKDRALVVFKILLEVSHGYYIVLEDFENAPLIVRPFEACHREYGPLDLYSLGSRRLHINNLLGDARVRQRLVLATSQGRYTVTEYIHRWEPIVDAFRNHLTGVVRPLRSTVEGTSVGSGIVYIVKLVLEGGREEIVPIHPRDFIVRKFAGFPLTRESLESREALELFLLERAVAGQLRCSDLTVFDLDEWRRRVYDYQYENAIEADSRSWVTYHVIGWFVTRWNNLKMRYSNRAYRQRHRERLNAKARPGADGRGSSGKS